MKGKKKTDEEEEERKGKEGDGKEEVATELKEERTNPSLDKVPSIQQMTKD